MTPRLVPFLTGALLLLGSSALSGQAAQTAPAASAEPAPVQGDEKDGKGVLDSGSDHWLFNAAERTRRGQEAMERGEAESAMERFDTVLRLRPEDPVARFNAGTARLVHKRPGAQPLLEAATRDAGPGLRAPASYNLGNARLDAGDLPGAISAYEDALRADPTFADAKHNLEVALRRLQEQQQEQDSQNQDSQNQSQDPQQEQQDQSQQEQDQQDQGRQEPQDQEQQGEGDQEKEQENEGRGEEEEGEDEEGEEGEGQEGDEPQEPGGAGRGEEESPLPQFEDLPDMTAEEAAAILEAIQNMERQDRRDQALEAAEKARASGKKDW